LVQNVATIEHINWNALILGFLKDSLARLKDGDHLTQRPSGNLALMHVCLDHAYVVAPNKIDEDRKANLIKSIFKSWPPIRFRRRPPFGATILSQRTPIRAS
jgi:hypothetical protein